MDQTQLAFFLIIIAGFLQGTFGIFIKNTAPLKWENFWVIFSLLAFFIGPFLFAYSQVPHLFSVLSSVPPEKTFLPLLFGAMWGIGAITFGICVVKIGISLTYSIILGIVTLLGSILPIFINKIIFSAEALALIVIGLLIILAGISLSGYAGILKDKILNPKTKPQLGGIILAVISGIFSAQLNTAFVTGKEITLQVQSMGVAAESASALVSLIAIFGGFIFNISYAIYLLNKNKTFKYFNRLNFKTFLPVLISSLCWYGTFALFGISSQKLGELGPSVGWAMLIALSIVVSNIWGIKFGEWEGVNKALKLQLVALGLIIIGVILIATSAFI